MGFVGIDVEGARQVGLVMREASGDAEESRRRTMEALTLAELSSDVPQRLAKIADGLATFGKGVTEKADLAASFTVDPKGVAAGLNTPVENVKAAISGLLGFSGPSDLRSVLAGLPPPGADAALDAALARLTPSLLPALLAGQKPTVDETQTEDLRLLALRLGIEAAGPPALVTPAEEQNDGGGSFFSRLVRRAPTARTGTEVFWQDFWADGRTVAQVLADPAQLMEWVSGTFELDRRLAVATELPRLADILTSVDFATGADTSPADLDAEVAASFAAIDAWLPEVLAGLRMPAPTDAQVAQTLAFAARVGWPDPGAAAATADQRLASALAFLTANRALASALLPTSFEGVAQPLAFFDATGIGQLLDLGRRVGVVSNTALLGLAGTTDQLARAVGLDLTSITDDAAKEKLRQLFLTLVSSKVPPAFLQTPGLGPLVDAALTYVGNATDLPERLTRITEAVAAFGTLAVTGAPALTERQLTAVVGQQVVDTLGRGRLRARSASAFQKNPEFLLVVRQWGVPGGHKETIGKYKFTWSFDDTGALSGIRRKKKSFFSRVADTFKAIVKSIGDSFEENPFKAIIQIGKLAVSALAIPFPVLAPVAIALNVGDAVVKAIDGDFLGALSSGLSVFTAGATGIFGQVPTAVDLAQRALVESVFGGTEFLGFVDNAKRALDIGTAVFRAVEADSLVGIIGAGLSAGATALGSGGQLLNGIGAIEKDVADELVRLGTTVADVTRIVAPTVGLIDALDRDDLVAALANGLAAVSAGAKAFGNEKGALSPTAPGVDGLLGLTPENRRIIENLAQGTGVTAFALQAVQALERGQTAQALSFVAQAVTVVNDPTKTVLGDRADIARRLADVAVIIESVADAGGDPTRVGPQAAAAALQRLQLLFDAAGTPPTLARPPAVVASGQKTVTAPGAAGAPSTLPPGVSTLPAGPITRPGPTDGFESPELTPDLISVPSVSVLSGSDPSGELTETGTETFGTTNNAFTGFLGFDSNGDIISGGAGSDTLRGSEAEDDLAIRIIHEKPLTTTLSNPDPLGLPVPNPFRTGELDRGPDPFVTTVEPAPGARTPFVTTVEPAPGAELPPPTQILPPSFFSKPDEPQPPVSKEVVEGIQKFFFPFSFPQVTPPPPVPPAEPEDRFESIFKGTNDSATVPEAELGRPSEATARGEGLQLADGTIVLPDGTEFRFHTGDDLIIPEDSRVINDVPFQPGQNNDFGPQTPGDLFLPDGTKIKIVPTDKVPIGELQSDQDPPSLAFADLPGVTAGTAFGEQRLAATSDDLRSLFLPSSVPDVIPGAAIIDALPGLPWFSPFAGAQLATDTTDSAPFGLDLSWAELPNAAMDDLISSYGNPADSWFVDATLDNQWSEPVLDLFGGAGAAMSWDSGADGDLDFGAVEMFSGDSYVSTEGF